MNAKDFLRQTSAPPPSPRRLQRKCTCGGEAGPSGECEECRKKRLQRQIWNAVPLSAQRTEAPASVHKVLVGAGQPLDRSIRETVEAHFGRDFSGVRVHNGAEAADSAREVGALAYTVGRDVVFGGGQFSPYSDAGLRLLSHELAHVVQQGGMPYVNGETLPVSSATDRQESEANAFAARPLVESKQAASFSGPIMRSVQRAVIEGEAVSGGATPDADPCAGWFADHQSMSKRAAELYVRTELQGNRGTVKRIECDRFLSTGEFACTVYFSDETPIRVIVRKGSVVVGVYPLQTMYPPADRPLCWYNYTCTGPDRNLVLVKDKCQSAATQRPTPKAPDGGRTEPSRGPSP